MRGSRELGDITAQHFRSHKVGIPQEEKVSRYFVSVSDCCRDYKGNRKDTENYELLGVIRLQAQTECTSSS